MGLPRIAMMLNTVGFGGVTEATLQLARHLPGGRYTRILYIMKHQGAASSERESRLQRFRDLDIEVHLPGDTTGRMDMIARAADWLMRERIDILHTHSFRPNIYGRLAGSLCRPAGLKLIAHYHNQYDDKWTADPATLLLDRQLASSTDAMIAVSDAVRDHVCSRLDVKSQRLNVVRNGFDGRAVARGDRLATRKRLGLADTDFAIGLVGRICEQKGQEDFIEAALALRDSHSNFRFVMVGDLEDKDLVVRLREKIERGRLSHRVIFTGHVTDMASMYAALDLLAAPSRWEGFGLMLVEAMAAGVPIVATTVGAIPEVVGYPTAAVLVPPRDPLRIAAAFAEIFQDPDRRVGLAQAGRIQARKFSWEESGLQLAAIYDRILEGARP